MCWPDDSQPPASQVCRWLPAIALGGAGADPSKAVQNPSGVCQGYETARASTLRASRIGRASDAHPAAIPYHACLTFRQSMVKVDRGAGSGKTATLC